MNQYLINAMMQNINEANRALDNAERNLAEANRAFANAMNTVRNGFAPLVPSETDEHDCHADGPDGHCEHPELHPQEKDEEEDAPLPF